MFDSFVVVAVFAVVEGISLAGTAIVLRWLYRKLEAVRLASSLDALTGVLGRRGLLYRIAEFTAEGRAAGVLLLDVLRFKDVNDGWGHDAGDDLLIAVAQRLTETAAAFDAVVGRLGGDEFVILLPGNPSQARLTELAGQVHQAMARPVFVAVAGVEVHVGVVAGAAVATADPVPGRPFRAADIACYHARRHRQPFAVYRPGMVHPATEQRHGDRLRDLRPAPLAAVFDSVLFERLVAGEVSSDRAHPDDVAELGDLLEVLDPRSRDFGTDVQQLVARCVEHGVLRLSDPIAEVIVEPTVTSDSRDGGFRVLVALACGPLLASPRLDPRAVIDSQDTSAVRVMAAVTEAITAAWDRYRTASTRSDW